MDTKSANDYHEDEHSSHQSEESVSSGGGRPSSGYAVDDVVVAQEEDKWVWRLRLLMTLALLGVAVAVCVVVYWEGRQAETDAFESDFNDLGVKLVRSFELVVEQRFGIISSFAETITSDAQSTGSADSSGFPFVTPPSFTYRVETTAKLAQLMFLMYLPKVQASQIEDWSNYTSQNADWLAESVERETGKPALQDDLRIFPTIMNVHNPNGPTPALNVTPTHTEFYPMWCNWPASVNGVNVDLYGDVEHRIPIDNTVSTGKPSFEVSTDYIDREKDGRYNSLVGNPYFDYQDDPHAVSIFPVFESFASSRVAGILICIIYWRTYFDDLLPPGSDGIDVILENTCDQQYTYRIDGTESTFVGHGDLHDTKYDYLEAGTTIDSVIDNNDNVHDSQQSGRAYANCYYSIRVYPSQQFEDDHRTNKPWIYVLVLASLFLFVSATYLLYDYMVQRRQRIVLQSAQQSGRLVNTLFPQDVRDELYKDQQEKAQQQQQAAAWESNHNQQEQAQQLFNVADSNHDLLSRPDLAPHKKAIANLYPETTIYFADLVGFTAWSSTRTPVDVFQLLETLYGVFDEIAMKRKVYKIETIGDCYVAATGLPEAQPDHAVIMCKFATDCMNKMNVLTASLADSLGEDTAELAMRIGLHSGPVTAGVLRGQKSRFQLFGDTVNTASRMESNGVPNRIHVSQQTAEALIAKGKESWITPRSDKIIAKGKGELQTYFVDTTKKSKSTVSGLTTGDTTIRSSIGSSH